MNDAIVRLIAEAAHEANRLYCQAIGDHSQPRWVDAPDWQRSSAIAGVRFTAENPDATPADSHGSWLEQKRRDGWKHGPIKDPVKREHPCFVPYDQLPAEQKAKDAIFQAVVRTLLEHQSRPFVVTFEVPPDFDIEAFKSAWTAVNHPQPLTVLRAGDDLTYALADPGPEEPAPHGLQRYRSIKIVAAGEIVEVHEGGCRVREAKGEIRTLAFEPDMTARYTPVPGDFWVIYDGGYQSISPRAAFLPGYVPVGAPPSSSPAQDQS